MASFLIVDDHAGFRRLARLLLEQAGYEVVGESGDADAALAAIAELDPDVVLLDVNLPGASGFELTELIARRQSPPDVVLTSTHDGRDYETLARRSPARGFLPKHELSGAAIGRLLG